MELAPQNLRGLTTVEVENLQASHGLNELPKAKKNRVREWLLRLASPISLMLIAASGLSFFLGKDFDGWFILALLVGNLGITFWHERKADHALAALEAQVTTQVKVLRDEAWRLIDSREIVVGDLVELAAGSVVPADADIKEANRTSVNEAAITGESLPVEKKEGDILSMGSYIVSGVVRARVSAIGGETRFGAVIAHRTGPRVKSVLEKDILTISRFLSGIAVAITVALSIALYAAHQPLFEIIRLDLTLLIAGIPVALPVVMSVIISIGVLRLSEHAAIVRRLAALEDLANVDLLLSDKTGTLTANEITVQSATLFNGYDEKEAAGFAAATATQATYSTLEAAIAAYAVAHGAPSFAVSDFIPADSTRKRSTVTAVVDGAPTVVTLGAPQIVEGLVTLSAKTKKQFEAALHDAGMHGYRALALAVKKGRTHGTAPEEKGMQLVALFFLSDTLRSDAPEVIEFLRENSVAVKMLTGDNVVIAKEVAAHLALTGDVLHDGRGEFAALSADAFEAAGVFAEILPEDKEALVKIAQRRHIVAVTGDGINDLPAVRIANVGIAVKNAVDALKQVADIVLIQNGIAVIKDAIVESRKIFTRIYSYSIYRISESFRVIITVAFFGTLFLAPILTPLQLLILALLNDLPIISLAFNRVYTSHKPAVIDVKRRFMLSLLYGTTGVINSIIFFFIARDLWHLPWTVIQTLFFLKLTVSGHMLVFVAHTKERWYRFLPSRTVVFATTATQALATGLALFGVFMTAAPLWAVGFVWVWAFLWMQVADLMKIVRQRLDHTRYSSTAAAVTP